MFDTGVHLSSLAADSQAFADRATGLDAAVPTCPDWTVGDLVAHLGRIYSWVCLVLDAAGERPTGRRAPAPNERDALVPWFLDQRAAVLDALTSREPGEKAWNFSFDPDTFYVSWWRRRQAMETSIHLYDIQTAAGAPAPIAPELAADGIDEVLTVFLPGATNISADPVEGITGTLHLHCTDTDGEWVVDFNGPAPLARREHAKADAAIRGPASDLFLLVWNRRPLDGLEVFGPRETAEAFSRIKF
jgi:uncharacterized protein (TIGR03083 family)